MATKTTSPVRDLGSFINSPKFGKLFKLLFGLLIIGAAVYGIYTIISQRFSSASSSNTWYYNSAGIKHQAGSAKTGNLYTQGILDSVSGTGASGPVWYGDSTAGASNKYVWYGPNLNLPTNRQYLGCFIYQLSPISTSSEDNGIASLDVYNSNAHGKVYNSYWVSDYVNYSGGTVHGIENITHQTRGKGNFARTCLAFFIAKNETGNKISLRVKLYTGRIAVKLTQITQVNATNYNLPDLKLLQQRPDNSTIMQGADYK